MTSIQTNWVVITGAPSSGKTSIIKHLDMLGYRVSNEVARAYIRKLMHYDVDIKQIRADLKIQEEILSLKLSRERSLDPDKLIFFDRGLPDSLAYYKLHHFPDADVYKYLYYFRYNAVFFLEPLPLVHDEIRTESPEIAMKLNQLIYHSYVESDYEPIRVPVMSIEDRTQFILGHLDELDKPK